MKEIADKLRKAAKGETGIDKKEMLKLADLIEAGKDKAAHKHYRSMDTFVREGVPDDVRTHICINRVKSKKEIPVIVKLKGCKRVFKEDMGPGVIYKSISVFPGDATDSEIAMALVRQGDELIKELVEVEFGKVKKVKK